MRRLGGEHACFEGQMDTFQPHRVQESGRIADDHSPAKVILWERPIAAFRDRLCAVRAQSPTFENAAYIRVCFEFLKPLMGIESRIEIVQTNNESNRYKAFRHVVNESTAKLFVAQWPAHCVNDA